MEGHDDDEKGNSLQMRSPLSIKPLGSLFAGQNRSLGLSYLFFRSQGSITARSTPCRSLASTLACVGAHGDR